MFKVNTWNKTIDRTPKEGQIVDTKVVYGAQVTVEERCLFSAGRWWSPDGKNYVYVIPTHWREIRLH